MFKNQRFAQAAHCFRRAHATSQANIANAYFLRELARRSPSEDKRAHAYSFAKAADAFRACAIETVRQAKRFMRIAGQLYAEACDDENAARAFLSAECYSEAALHFKNAALYEDAVTVVKSHRNTVDPNVAEAVVNVTRLFYLKDPEAHLE